MRRDRAGSASRIGGHDPGCWQTFSISVTVALAAVGTAVPGGTLSAVSGTPRSHPSGVDRFRYCIDYLRAVDAYTETLKWLGGVYQLEHQCSSVLQPDILVDGRCCG